jgi:squalene-hopene/tetraprenyl-beta-curcumene cyclase
MSLQGIADVTLAADHPTPNPLRPARGQAGTSKGHDAGPARAALQNARDHLLGLQDPAGWWKGELETNVTMEAEDLMLRQFLGIREHEQSQETARWIRAQQRADGTWATFYAGPADVSTTVEAYIALRLAGDDPGEPHMAKAAEFVRSAGGVEASRVFTRLWLALFGLWSWDDLPTMPPEMIFLPSWFPLNIYDWACWARQTVVPLTIVNTVRPSRPIGFEIDELRTYVPVAARHAAPWTVAGLFQRLDRGLHRYAKVARGGPARSLRRLAMRRAAEWIIARQEADGSWGGIQPPWVYSLMALNLLGYSVDHPVIRTGLEGLDGFTVREPMPAADGSSASPDAPIWRRLEACQSPVWDTALAVIALSDAGLPADDPRLVKAGQWLVNEEITVKGDWSVKRPHLLPGGWAFEFDNDGYPDTDDTAEVVLALRRVQIPEQRQLRGSMRRGVAWTLGMQCKDGGWGAFDVDNTRSLILKLPFCDFGAVIDPPTADVTAHIIEMLGMLGMGDGPAAQAGKAWLLRNQEADGSWFGRWGANYIYGTGAVVPALVAAGVSPSAPAIRRAVRWIERHQNSDGGWGEDLRSYKEPKAWVGRGDSTASQTAWALLALLAAGEDSDTVRRGIGWLVDTQRPDGTWDEPQYTGTGFPGDFSINYHLYRLIFPINALGRYVAARGGIELEADRVIDLTAPIPGQHSPTTESDGVA